MPNRSKHEAQTRLDIGVARVLLRKELDVRERLETMKEHFAIVQALDIAQLPPVDPAFAEEDKAKSSCK